jgi:hypothetical protein
MAARVNMVGFNSLISKLGARQRSAARAMRKTVRVGYSAPYALRIHEDLEIDHEAHGCGGQAKFLEQPARMYRKVMASIVRNSVVGRTGPGDLEAAIVRGFLAAGLFLKKESQELVPVQTGFLRDSAFVWIEDR